MSEQHEPSRNEDRTASLARIAEALRLPIAYFDTTSGKPPVEDFAKLGGKPLLALVRTYLQAVDPHARRHFVEAVKAIADELSR